MKTRILLARAVLGTVGTFLTAALVAKRRLPVRAGVHDDDIALVSIFDGTNLRPTSTGFLGGSIVSVFGGTNLDLRRAGLTADGAKIYVTTLFGGTEITVPDTWVVTVRGLTLAAGVEVAVTDPSLLDAAAPSLTIAARTLFGGMSVTSRPVLRPAAT